jgi:hypothetical protein
MFCAPGLVFGGTEGVWSHFHVLRSRTHFWRCRGRRVPFSCLVCSYSFSWVPRASHLVFMFPALGHVFSGTEVVGSRFHVLRSRTHFRRYRERWVPFSCIALPDSFSAVQRASGPDSCFARPETFSAVPWASGPVFMFCALGLIFGGAGCVWSGLNVLRARTHFRRCRGRWVPFSCLALSYSFSTVPRASHPVFMFAALGHVFSSTEGVGSRFHVFRSRTRFWRYRERRDPYSCFARPDSFLAVSRALGPFFIFCAPEIDFGVTECVGSHFQVLRARTHFRRYRGRPIQFSCFPLPDMFSAVPRASGPVFMFCVPVLVFGGTEGVGSHFHDLRSLTRFRWYRGRQVSFSSFALTDSFSAVPRASGLAFMFCAPGIVFGRT